MTNTVLSNGCLSGVREQFPIFTADLDAPLVYLDTAASSQTPQCVIDAMTHFYCSGYSNIHRGVHRLSAQATLDYEAVRDSVQHFINAEHREEIVFTSGTTAAINLVAECFSASHMQPGDEIIISAMEHHANIVPWQMLRDRMGVVLKVLPMDDNGECCLQQLSELISDKTKLLAITHVSNVLGTVNDVAQMTHIAKQRGVRVLLDGAQAVAHRPVDVQALNCDFYVFSSHKLYGPTGLGVLYGRHDLLNAMPPYQGGGDMIQAVSLAQSTFQQAPHRFEAGTPNIAAVLGLGAAIEFMQQQSWSQVMAHEAVLLQRFQQGLTQFTAARVLGQPRERSGVVSFVWRDVHAHDIGTILDQAGVAVRVGHHCAMPIMQHFKVPATTRASFGIYNTADDVDACLHALQRVEEIFHS